MASRTTEAASNMEFPGTHGTIATVLPQQHRCEKLKIRSKYSSFHSFRIHPLAFLGVRVDVIGVNVLKVDHYTRIT